MKKQGGDLILKMHQCSFCPKTFPSASKLRRHHLVHTGQKPFVCLTCGKGFSQAEHLKTHTQKVHVLCLSTGSLMNGCFANDQRPALSNHNAQENYRHDISAYGPLSSALFSSVPVETEQKKEMLILDTGQTPFTCVTCGKSFSQAEHLRTHMQRVHVLSSPTDSFMNGGFANDQRPALTNHNAQENYREDINAYGPLSPALFSSVPVESELKKEMVAPDVPLPSPEDRTKPEPPMPPHFDNGFMINSSISANGTYDVMGPVPQHHVGPAAVDNAPRYANNNGYACKVCLRSFSSPLQLQIHSSIHTRRRPFEGGVGGGKAFSRPGLMTTLNAARGKITASHQCPSCPKAFCSPSKLRRHFLIHTGQKPFCCMVCGKTFRQEPHLNAHLRGAHKMSGPNDPNLGGERTSSSFPSGDPTSNSGFRSSSAPSQHPAGQDNRVNSSSGELELQCKISVSAPRDTEIKSETAERAGSDTGPRRSSEPVGSETSKGSVEREQRPAARADLKPFKCQICSRSFRLGVNLMRHQAYHKNQQKGFQSKSAAANVSNAVSEPFRVNPEPIKTSPGPSLEDPLDLNIIVKSETWNESLADDKGNLLQRTGFPTSAHQQSATGDATGGHQGVMDQSQQCQTCSKGFPSLSELQSHMMSHSGPRPFGCLTCGKSFRDKTHLRIHSRTHLWSKYHKQRSLYISRPPSRTAGIARLADDVARREMFARNQAFGNNSGGGELITERRLGQVDSPSVWNDGNTEPRFLPSPAKDYDVLHSMSVPNVTLDERRTVKAVQSTSPVKHKCFLCFKCFPSASKLKTHEMVHTGLKPFRCPTCGKMFRQTPHLKAHQRTHLQENLKLPQRTNMESNLKAPQRTNMESNLKLPQRTNMESNLKLPQRTNMDSNLKAPPRIHMESNLRRPPTLQGKISMMKIRSQQQPQYPRINVHLPSPNRSTEINTVGSKYPPMLSNQRQFEHPIKSEKPVPNNVNHLDKSKVTNQQSEHPPTSVNSSVPNRVNSFIKSRVMMTKPLVKKSAHTCRLCLKSFATPSKLSRHLLIHSGIRPYKCSLCTKTFTQMTHLKVHERSRVHDTRPADYVPKEVISTKQNLPAACLDNGAAPETLITAYLVYPQDECPPPSFTDDARYLVTNDAFPLTSNATATEGLAIGGMDINTEAIDTKGVAIAGMDMSTEAIDTKGVAIAGMDINTEAIDTKGVVIAGMDINTEAIDTKGVAIAGMDINTEAIDTKGVAIAGMHINTEAIDTKVLAIGEIDISTGETDTEGLAIETTDMEGLAIEATDTEGLAIAGTENSDTEEMVKPEVGISPEATDAEVSVIPELSLLEEKIESERKQGQGHGHGYNQTHDFLARSSFPSDLACEIQRLVQRHDMSVPSVPQPAVAAARGGSSVPRGSLDVPFQTGSGRPPPPTHADNHKALGDRLMSAMAENPLLSDITDYYWCEPLNAFECDKCSRGFETDVDLKRHKCTEGGPSSGGASVQPVQPVQPVQKYKCDVCFKDFVSPSKLHRHYIIHTGLRPFRCDTCGKGFTQATHLKTHLRIHKS